MFLSTEGHEATGMGQGWAPSLEIKMKDRCVVQVSGMERNFSESCIQQIFIECLPESGRL